ncbi:hypothetical protein ACFL2T_04590 [Elusimicrobiota bacterium]
MIPEEQLQGSVYSNNKFGVAIRFPEGWRVVDGDGRVVIKQAFGPNRSGMNVTVSPDPRYQGQELTHDWMKSLVDAASRSMVLQLAGQVRDRSIGEINGHKVGFCTVAALLRTSEEKIPMIYHQIVTVKHSILYVITASIREADIPTLDRVVKDSLATLVLAG